MDYDEWIDVVIDGGSIDDQFSNLINWFSFPFVIIFPSCGKPHSHV